MAENNIMGMVGAFIGIAIMLGIGIQILGNSIQDCTALPDYSVGELVSVTVNDGGNFTSTPTGSVTGGGGSGAFVAFTMAATGGGNVLISSATVTAGGLGYTSAPTIDTVGGGEVSAANLTGVISSDVTQIGWAAQCMTTNTQTQNAYTLLVIILIVVAAVAILSVVRMLG